MEKRNLIIALHGFLGTPSDWEIYLKKIKKPSDIVISPFLFTEGDWCPRKTLLQWTTCFKNKCENWLNEGYDLTLLGYSMGGRLGLCTYLDQPDLFKEAHFFSVNPGIDNIKELEVRKNNDAIWAERFRSETWNTVLTDWNQQPVFIGDLEPIRLEKDFSRELLALSLTQWSLSEQQNLWPKLAVLNKPIGWWVGEKDLKFLNMAKQLNQENPNIQIKVVPNCGHRVLFKLG